MTDAQTFHSAQVFLKAAHQLNITILVSTSFATGITNLTTQMQEIKQSQARVILFMGTIIDQQVVIDNSLRCANKIDCIL